MYDVGGNVHFPSCLTMYLLRKNYVYTIDEQFMRILQLVAARLTALTAATERGDQQNGCRKHDHHFGVK
jgi:hypothetical protein